jgi:hypothetical protein
MASKPPYWFPAKRYGWGWGMPLTWQGRTVLVTFLALFGGGFLFFPPEEAPIALLAYVAFLTVALRE